MYESSKLPHSFCQSSNHFYSFILLFISVYLCLCTSPCECKCQHRPEEGVRPLELELQVLGTELRASGRAVCTSKHRPVSPALWDNLFFISSFCRYSRLSMEHAFPAEFASKTVIVSSLSCLAVVDLFPQDTLDWISITILLFLILMAYVPIL